MIEVAIPEVLLQNRFQTLEDYIIFYQQIVRQTICQESWGTKLLIVRFKKCKKQEGSCFC
jgi:hypothetical protein